MMGAPDESSTGHKSMEMPENRPVHTRFSAPPNIIIAIAKGYIK